MSSITATTPVTVNPALLPVQMPAIQKGVSANSRELQKGTRRILFGILVLTSLYAFSSPIGQVPVIGQLPIVIDIKGYSVNVISAFAVILFVIAFALQIYRAINRPERKWYTSRGLSEEIKAFVWRFAVGGEPLGIKKLSRDNAEESLKKTLRAFLRKAHSQHLDIPIPTDSETLPFVTDWMSKARDASLADRQILYAVERIHDQQQYYRNKELLYRRDSKRWSVGLFGTESLLLIATALHAVGVFPIDVFGVSATVVAAATAWIQFNQYRALADLYRDMAFELGLFNDRCLHPAHAWTEDSWASFVNSVETFLEAEHSAWRRLVDPDGSGGATVPDA